MPEVKLKVLEFANKVSGKKMGSKSAITIDDPRYTILEPVVTEEMAEVALAMEFRKPLSAEELAERTGKPLELVKELCWELSLAGVCFVNQKDGVDKYWYDTWVPGIMEMMNNNLENVRKYPQIAKAFEAYGQVVGPMSVGKFPIGVGAMRVIPIEKAIQGETRKASYEEISKYLNENTVFSVSDCSCRTSREALGEGCGHLKEDMCIQMGHAAEYYIRTGRGRAITKDEAFEIIRKAEENGLMHQIPNLDGSGKTHAICNCCGCSCYALRIGNMFGNNDMIRSNYVASVDQEKCVACGQCVEYCPTNAVKLGQKIGADRLPQHKPKPNMRDHHWGEAQFNREYRTNRANVLETGTSPCKSECPAHIAVQGYIRLAAEGRYTEALELIKHENPFPAVCGRICPHKCESACTRCQIDHAVAIDEIKKFIAEKDLHESTRFIPRKRHHYNIPVAVVGAGPAGLSCAYYLALDGYAVTVFEKEERLGGMLTLGIPNYRLEKPVVEAEIDILKAMGVTFRTGVKVGEDITLDALRAQGFKAFYLAIGAQNGRKLNIENEDHHDVMTGVDFLRQINLGQAPALTGRVIVIGGGNVAIDVARTAVRLPVDSVTLVSLESRVEMPALPDELVEAEAEQVGILNGWGPQRILVHDGKITGVQFKRCVSVFDATKRFAPVYDDSDTMIVAADHVLVSVGQSIAWGNLLTGSEAQFNPNQTLKADALTYQTHQPDVFTGGDCYTGPRFAIDAIAAGKQGAISIHRFVHPGQSLVNGRDRRQYQAIDTASLDLNGYDRVERQQPLQTHVSSLKGNFNDPRSTLTEAQIQVETQRCLGCGMAIVDPYDCVGCGQCTTKCRFDAISLVRTYDSPGAAFEALKPLVIKTALKREARLMVKSLVKPFVKD